MKEICKRDATLFKLLPPVKLRRDISYIPSQFVFPFFHNGKRYVFNTLTKQCLESELPQLALAGEGFDSLIESLFLVPEKKDECAFYNSVSALMRLFRKKKGIYSFTILPTLACNARCIYCYEEGMKQISMTSEVVEQTIRYILANRQGNTVKLNWFGGEPLLGVQTIDRICVAMREAGVEYRSNMTSNGSLITPDIVKKMKDLWKLKHIQISMDGVEKDYRYRKNYYVYREYYHSVMDTVGHLSEAGIAVSIRCNVDEENWKSIPAYLEDLSFGIKHKDNVSVYFSPLNSVRLGQNDLAMWEKIIGARKLVETAGFRAAPFKGWHLHFRTNYCMADAGNVVITPDGSLFPCEHCPPGSRFGDIWQGATDENARQEFCRVDRTRDKCRKCPFLPECTSFANCPVEDSHCRQVRELFELEYLKRLVDQNNVDLLTEDKESPVC